MTFEIEKINNIDVVTLSGRFDTERAEAVGKHFEALPAIESGTIIVVMDKVDYISSSMIRILLRTLKKHRAMNGDLCLAALNKKILKVLKIAGMDALFTMFDSKAEALKSLE